jgi:hypothetical protein
MTASRTVAHAIVLLNIPAQVEQVPGADPIALRLRPTQDVRLQRGLLTGRKLLRKDWSGWGRSGAKGGGYKTTV